ncbi:MAG TPA: ATP-binding protein, partial [Opitutaceae bacterium]
AAPGAPGFRYDGESLVGFQPVVQGTNDRLGTLFVEFNSGSIIMDSLRASFAIGAAVLAVVIGIAYLLSRLLEGQISEPILALARTARLISENRDYSVRARQLGKDELGVLTEDFNRMLGQLQLLTAGLEQQVARRTAELEAANVDLNRSRSEVTSLFESLPGLYIVLTPDLSIVTASDAYLQNTQLRREAIIGRNLFEVFPEDPSDPAATGRASLQASFDRVLNTQAADTMAILKYNVKTPEGVYVDRYWSPINSPLIIAGKVKYIINRVEDVTDFVKNKSDHAGEKVTQVKLERMEAEIYRSTQQVQASNRQLEAANKELEAFSYSVSHDLRAPLRHVDGFASLLGKHAASVLDEKGRRLLDTISRSAKQMGRLIDDLLDFSRTGRTELRKSDLDQDGIVASIVKEGMFDREERRISWKIAPLPRIHADPALIRQVWANLIQNAVKYSGTNPSPAVEIGSTAGASEGETVFFVRDNGVGFDMKYVDKLFGVFQRLHAASEFEGTGIGLANVRRIVARHGGRTWAEGEIGKGATFYFSIFAGDGKAAAKAETETKA